MENEELKRLSVLKRMCRLSCVMLLVALGSLLVGIMALTYSAGKFPFNAGGAIIAGIVAAFMSICPMCMLVQAKQYQKTRKSSYNCCCLAMTVWSFIAILGIIFGLATNGIGAIIACNNRSKETGCWLNKESQFALAIVTLVLTILLLLLITTLLVICCCNCVLVGDVTDMDYYVSRHANLNYRSDIYRIPSADASHVTPGHTMLGQRFAGINDAESGGRENGHYITPTAPPVLTQYTSDIYTFNTSLPASRNSLGSLYNEHGHGPRRFGNTHAFESPPPTYSEVMENDPMETPL